MFLDLILCTVAALFLAAVTVPVVYIAHKIVSNTKRPFRLMGQQDAPIIPTIQEDPRFRESVKKTRKVFEAQWEEMNARALKAHSPECPDPWTCTKEKCFKFEPDKIVVMKDD